MIKSIDDNIEQHEFMGFLLSAPSSFWDAVKSTPELIHDVTNGCGPKGIGDWLVPDTVYFLNIKAACIIHDWCYWVWNDKMGFCIANDLFKNNMQRIIHQAYEKTKRRFFNTYVRDLRMQRSTVYYNMVVSYGERFYYDEPNS